MNLLNQIVPRLSRSPARRTGNGDETADREFVVKPAYSIKEYSDTWGVTVHLPGVAKGGLEITAEEGVIRIRGTREWRKPKEWTTLWCESVDAPFELELAHDHSINLDKIHAALKDGVLRASLPKSEAVKPRQIAVS
jgi:HSP20 family protein